MATTRNFLLWLLFSLIAMLLTIQHSVNCRPTINEQLQHPSRLKRQIDLTFAAEHDDKSDDTELVLEAIANLWQSSDGNTQIEGSAKVVHKSHSFNDGNNHYSARLHLHHDYKTTNKGTNEIKNCLDLSSMC